MKEDYVEKSFGGTEENKAKQSQFSNLARHPNEPEEERILEII